MGYVKCYLMIKRDEYSLVYSTIIYKWGEMLVETLEFAKRLTELRENKGTSAREMSLSLGLRAGYINNIENGHNYPSMGNFFYICEYLGVTPSEFFAVEIKAPTKVRELAELASRHSAENIDLLISLAKKLK